MTPITSRIGYSQRVRLEWLERVAELMIAGHPAAQIRASLDDLLSDQLSVDSTEGDTGRTNRDKVITILMRTWVTVPSGLKPLGDAGLAHLQRLPVADHLAVQWGMAMAVYPFWGAVAETVGRLVRLQDTVGAAHVQRRVREAFGERETVARATRRVLRSFIDWGVLEETGKAGIYAPVAPRPVRDHGLVAWLVAATLRASGTTSKPLDALVQSPALFPFALESPHWSDLAATGELEVVRQGLDDDIVLLIFHTR